MSEKLKTLVHKLGQDPTLVDRFKKDPEAVMEAHDLSDEHKDLIRNKDKEGIKKAAGLDDAHMNFIIF